MNKLSDERMRQVEAYVAGHLRECIRLADLAKIAGLSQFHFARQFKARTGIPPMRYVLGRKVDCARRHLSTRKLPLAAVAYHCGFCSQAHLTTAFKVAMGATPAAWRSALMTLAEDDTMGNLIELLQGIL